MIFRDFRVWIEGQYIADVISDSVMFCFRYVFPYTLEHYSDKKPESVRNPARDLEGGAGGAGDQGELTAGQT